MAVHVVVDGYNVIRQSTSLREEEKLSLEHGREALIEKLRQYKRIKGHRITVVFDGAEKITVAEEKTQQKGIKIIYSRQGRTADSVIRRICRDQGENVVVVTADGELASYAQSHGSAVMTSEEFETIVKEWIATAVHPVTGQLFTSMIYQPMLELLNYLRANGFKTFIVSGGGIEFMRPWAEKVYGIPPEQVVGSSIKTKFEMRDGNPVLVRLPEINFIDDKEGKPVGINQHIGRRPVAAFGNSDGDLQMLQWTMAGQEPRFALYVHHTDADREWAYDRDSAVGRLDKGLDEAQANGWTVVDMKKDWKVVYPEEKN